jgi:hypothetical protein
MLVTGKYLVKTFRYFEGSDPPGFTGSLTSYSLVGSGKMTESEKTVIQDILQLIQDYGDNQLKLWQERITGENQKPAADRICELIRERYQK